jgi:hypothetical protein
MGVLKQIAEYLYLRKAGSKQAQYRFYKKNALDKQDKHPDLYSVPDLAGNKIIFLR